MATMNGPRAQAKRLQVLLPCTIVFLGALLRCAQFNWSQYRRDDAIVLGMAQAALATHRVPWVGMISTLGIDNGPAQVWLVMLGTLAGPSPFAAEWIVALLNIVGIAACYAFGRCAFGRRVGLIAALLLAVSSWSVLYSRRLWGNDMTAPFAALCLWSLARVVQRGDRVHQVLVFVWAALLAQVYVVGIAELPAILVGLIGAALWRRLQLLPAALGVAAFLVLTGPYIAQTVLPELGSMHRLTGGQQAVTDTTSLRYLAETVGLDAYQTYLPQLARFFDVGANPLRLVSALAALLLAIGALRATCTMTTRRDGGQKILLVLLLVWVLSPVVATIRHGVSLFPHYELGAVPGTYVLMAIGIAWLVARPWTVWIGVAGLGIVVAGQVTAAVVFLTEVPNYVRGTQYGVPLADVEALGTAARTLVGQRRNAQLVVVGHDDGSEMGQALQTWVPNVAVVDDQGSLRVGGDDQHLVFLTTRDDSPLVDFLRQTAPGRAMRFPGDDTVFRLFAVDDAQLRAAAATMMPATPPQTLGGDVTLQGTSLTPEVRAGGSLLWAARWGVTPAGARDKPVASIFVHLLTPAGVKVAAHDEAFDNHAVLWQPGDEVLSWVTVPITTTTPAGTDTAVGGLYRLGEGGSIEPLNGPAGSQLDVGRVTILEASSAAVATAPH
jgi:4-amino-4-deoxy-L-arabinose transferase-like glycosyltransferase